MDMLDRDLQSVQAVRGLVRGAREAQKQLMEFSQEQIDRIVEAVARAGYDNAVRLGQMAADETGFGRADDKTIKNQFGSMSVYEAIKDIRTVGVLHEDTDAKVADIAVPMGVVAGLIPSTNPTSTVMYKALLAIKSGNAIVFSPHPGAKNCILETVRVLREAAEAAGCPQGALGCIEILTMESTNELMRLSDLILATGGTAMVKAAYSSGTPAIGVGPGNGPAFIERSADIRLAVKRIVDSKTFDNGTICASEQSIVTEDCIKEEVAAELLRQGAYFLSAEEKEKVSAVLMRPGGTMNPRIVGKSAQHVADLAGVRVPADTRVLVGFETEVGGKTPFSKEKLCPVLAFYVEPDWEAACETCVRILRHEGAGHTLIIHSNDESVIRAFALKKPVSRILVNTSGAPGGIGATTNLFPALTLGCGAVGGSSTSDNIGPLHLINIRRLAYGVRELDDIRAPRAAQPAAQLSGGDEDALVRAIVSKILHNLERRAT
ncbi:MAG: acetaldehyde dehydrogenase (acetylating) [Oscillospiraceae bacterium]|jgi:acetaldehyde dehydrogenase (acetylating)|nr:acetaldehyde dehydrogenase (acetylating) [Oscillospiraceae bacterium]